MNSPILNHVKSVSLNALSYDEAAVEERLCNDENQEAPEDEYCSYNDEDDALHHQQYLKDQRYNNNNNSGTALIIKSRPFSVDVTESEANSQQTPPVHANNSQQQPKGSSNFSAFANIIKANVGTGILGMPYAFRCSGYILGTVTVILLAILTVHCTTVLVKCKNRLNRMRESESLETGKDAPQVVTYGQVGRGAFGILGDVAISIFLIFSQCGFCCAYLIFIGENTSDLLGINKAIAISVACVVLVPISFIRSLRNLAIFSILSELMLSVGIVIVVYFSIRQLATTEFPGPTRHLQGFTWAEFPVFFGITIFSFEGIGLALPIQHSMNKRKSFNSLLTTALTIISSLMMIVGLIGYLAYGQAVNALITRNLPAGVLSLVIKIGLMTALLFTYPIMLFPVTQLLDQNFLAIREWWQQRKREHQDQDKVTSSHSDDNEGNDDTASKTQYLVPPESIRAGIWNPVTHYENFYRVAIIIATGVLASAIPNFGNFLSLIGGLGGTLLAFVFPSCIHLKLFWSSTNTSIKMKDLVIIFFGVGAAILTTIMSVKDIVVAV